MPLNVGCSMITFFLPDKFQAYAGSSFGVDLNELEQNPKKLAQYFLFQCTEFSNASGLEKKIRKSMLCDLFKQVMQKAEDIPAHLLVRCMCANPGNHRQTSTRRFSVMVQKALSEIATESNTEKQGKRLKKLSNALTQCGLFNQFQTTLTTPTGQKQTIPTLMIFNHSPRFRQDIGQKEFLLHLPPESFSIVALFFENDFLDAEALTIDQLHTLWRLVREDGQAPLPRLARDIEEMLVRHTNSDNVAEFIEHVRDDVALSEVLMWVNGNYDGVVTLEINEEHGAFQLQVHKLASKALLEPLVSLCPRLVFTSYEAFQEFLSEFQQYSFSDVEALELAFVETLRAEEASHLLELFPSLTALRIEASCLQQDELENLLRQSIIDCVVINNCESQEPFDLAEKKCIFFFTGEKVPANAHLFEPHKYQQFMLLPNDYVADDDEWMNLTACFDRHLLTLIELYPKLPNVKIDDSPDLSDKAIATLVRECRELEEIGLSWCDGLTDQALVEIAKHGSQIRLLEVTGNTQFTDAGLVAISKHCWQLSKLLLWGCSSLTDEALVHFLQRRNRLEILEITDCSSLSDAVIIFLSRHSIAIDTLRLRQGQFSEVALQQLRIHNPRCNLQIAGL